MGRKGLNIYHRRDGRWEGRYRGEFCTDGKPKYRSVYAKTYSEVKEKLIKLKSIVNENTCLCSLTVKQLFDEWMNMKKISVKESTVANYQFKIEKHLLPYFGKFRFNALSPRFVYDFIYIKKTEGLSEKYISDMIVVLKSMAKYASKTYHCTNEISDIELPKSPKKELNMYSGEEQEILKSELFKEINPTNLGILLCLYTGIRIGELCALKWCDIDLLDGLLHISKTCQRIKYGNSTKIVITSPKSTASDRVIPLPEFLLNILKDFAPSEKNSYLLSGSEKIVEPRTMQYRFKSTLKKANLPSANFHSLRHIFATNCIALGFDVKTLSEILGHRTVEITLNRYVHSSISRKRKCMELLNIDIT
ncbi:MAG: site-specific integrase [Ruminococcus flavefaciens]|nr:site-specific integrase [Ruminococcus flavefaciens]